MTSARAGKKHGPWRDAFLRFKKDHRAIIGLVILVVLLLCAVFADIIAPYGYADQNLTATFQPPSAAHWFGTDNLGRDIFSRVIYGTRISFSMAIITVLLATFSGGLLGAVAGYCGGKVDSIIMRTFDVLMALPSMLLAIAVAASLGAGLVNTAIAITIGQMPGLARTVRAAVISIRGEEYIRAARSIGAGSFRIMFKHIIPNALAPILVQATLYAASAILTISSLSFIGLGVEPPTAEWGSMLSSARGFMRGYGYMVIFPGLAIVITIYAINMMGDGLRDALDPRLKD